MDISNFPLASVTAMLVAFVVRSSGSKRRKTCGIGLPLYVSVPLTLQIGEFEAPQPANATNIADNSSTEGIFMAKQADILEPKKAKLAKNHEIQVPSLTRPSSFASFAAFGSFPQQQSG